KLKGDYLSVITLGFGMVIVNVINNLSFAGGDGLSHGNASSALYKTGLGLNSVLMRKYVWLALVFTAVSVAVMYMYVSSKYGRNIRAIRDDEIAAESSGIDVVKNKITTFVLSSFFAGIAGGLYACCTKSISTVDFAFSNSGILNSVFIVVIVIFGGMGSFSGSVVSAIVLYIINYLIKQSGLQNVNGIIGTFFGYPMLCYALLLIITVMLKPDGLFSMKKGLVRRKKRRSEY
ncbi:MAG: branched-chain amino acid ABC transporter permease, partial [Clostridia bacterium]|nr:branched-chain amino acid ABC transporter permease [Clostridia bacterium]